MPASSSFEGLTPFPIVIRMEDELVHTINRPFCKDETCPCHSDGDLLMNCLFFPLFHELLLPEDAQRIYRGEQAVPLCVIAYDD